MSAPNSSLLHQRNLKSPSISLIWSKIWAANWKGKHPLKIRQSLISMMFLALMWSKKFSKNSLNQTRKSCSNLCQNSKKISNTLPWMFVPHSFYNHSMRCQMLLIAKIHFPCLQRWDSTTASFIIIMVCRLSWEHLLQKLNKRSQNRKKNDDVWVLNGNC